MCSLANTDSTSYDTYSMTSKDHTSGVHTLQNTVCMNAVCVCLVFLQTLELLYRITNAQNVCVIVEKMLAFLRLCQEDYTIIDLVGKVAELAEKYPLAHITKSLLIYCSCLVSVCILFICKSATMKERNT